MHKFIRIFILLLIISNSHAQKTSKQMLDEAINEKLNNTADGSRKKDSLLKVINATTSDTVKIKLYLQIIEIADISESTVYALPAIHLADKLIKTEKDSLRLRRLIKLRYEAVHYAFEYYDRYNLLTEQENILKAHISLSENYAGAESTTLARITLANFYFKKGELLKQLNCLQDGYEKSKNQKDYKGVSRFLIQTMFFYAQNKDTAMALEYINKAIENEIFINDTSTSRVNRTQILRGKLYAQIGQFEKAIQSYRNAIEGYLKANDKGLVANAHRELGDVYQKKREYKNALESYANAEALARESNNMIEILQSMIGRGDVYSILGRYNEAIEGHKWLWDKIAAGSGDNLDNPTYVFLGIHLTQDYFLSGDYKSANGILKIILQKLKGTALIDQAKVEKLAFKTDSAMGNYKNALIHHQNYISMQSKLNDAEISKAGAQQKFKNDYDRQKLADKLEQDKKEELSKAERKKQNVILISVSCFLLLMILLVTVVFRSLRINQRNNKTITRQKIEVEQQKTPGRRKT